MAETISTCCTNLRSSDRSYCSTVISFGSAGLLLCLHNKNDEYFIGSQCQSDKMSSEKEKRTCQEWERPRVEQQEEQ